MNRNVIALLCGTAFLVAGCTQKTDTTSSTVTENTAAVTAPDVAATQNVAAPMAIGGQAFANGAAASDAFEIASSTLASTNASAPAVKKFAAQMIAAHTDSTAQLKTVAARLSPAIMPDPALNPDQRAKLDELKTMKGSDFDRAYLADQIGTHEQALAALQDYAANGDVPDLKQFASTLAPKVAAHLNMAKAIKP